MDRYERQRQPGFEQVPGRLFVWPFEIMLRFQAHVVSSIRESTESWMERRQQAADGAIEALERLMQCRDIGEAITIQQEWLEETFQRASEDIDTFAKQGAAISHEAASSTKETGSKAFYGARAAARQLQRAGESLQAEGEREAEDETEGKHQTARHGTRRRSREHHRA